MGHRPRVKRGRDADRLLTAIVSTGNGASFTIYLLGVFNTAQAMRDTQNTEARRPITRTYEGVQWFKHTDRRLIGHGEGSDPAVWVASIPGTPLAVVRRPPCALDPHTSCYIAVSRVSLDGVRRFYHFDGMAVANSFPLTHAEKTAVWRISEAMPFWTVPINMKIRYPRFENVRHASRVVAELRRAVDFLKEAEA